MGDCKRCAELSEIDELKTAGGKFLPEGYFKIFVDDDELFFVAEEEGKLLGYILGEPMKGNMAFLGLLTADKGSRGKGIGKKLIAAFRNKCDEKGLKFILLYAPKFNENTIEFYNKCQFTQGKEYINFLEERD
ncbi:MAG: GNAT family N-acetyltransferase [Candidatus Woesearchaeota archaeon]